MSVNEKMTAIANEVRSLSGVADKLSLDEMAAHTKDANAEVVAQESLIQQIATALQGKAVGGGQAKKKLRYIKFVVNDVRTGGTQMQFSELDFLDADGNRYNWPTTAIVTSPNVPATSAYEAQNKIIDGLTSTKFCTVQFVGGAYLLIDLGEKERLDVRKFCKWQWWTGNDNFARDPISFELWGSEDGDEYELLDSAVKVDVTTARQAVAYTNWIRIVENTPDTDSGEYDRGYADGYADGEESKNNLEDGLLAKTLTEYRNIRPVTIGNRFFSYFYNLISVDLPNAVSVDQYAFVYCTSLQKITLPSVTTIGPFAFQDSSSLTVVDLHKVNALQSNVFNRTNITTLILRKTDGITTNGSTAVFNNTPISKGEGFIYVPAALVEQYKSATNWSSYSAQFRAIEDYPEITGG